MNTVQIDPDVPPHADEGADGPGSGGLWGRVGQLLVRRSRLVLVLFGTGVVLAAVLGSQVFGALQAAGYDDPTSESAHAMSAVRQEFGVEDPAVILAVETPAGVDETASVAQASQLVEKLSRLPGVTDVVSYWTSGKPDYLRGSDGRTGQVLLFAQGAGDTQQTDLVRAVNAKYGGDRSGLVVHTGGFAGFSDAITDNITTDLASAESISIPITLVLLILVFGGVVAAGLPFVVAAGAILGSFLAVWLVTLTTDVSIFSLNLITGLGLGLGIDYALLIVNRFREELQVGRTTEQAVVRTVETAGRTVAVSGATVAVVLGALLFFPQYFLRSFGYAGIAVTLLAVLSATTALPALLAVLGPRVDKLKVHRGSLAPSDVGLWSRVARFVMRRPWPVLLVVGGLLALLASPALSATFSQVDSRVLPADDPAAVAARVLGERFPGQEGTPIQIVVPGAASDTGAVRSYAERLSELPNVTRVSTPQDIVANGAVVAPNPQPDTYTSGQDVRIAVVNDIEQRSTDGQSLVGLVRAVPAPSPGRLVGGVAAEYADSQSAIGHRGVWALLWVALATLVVLFLYTGSLLLPVKAVALNVLSLSATLGVLVWVFQDGHLMWLVGDFTVTHTVDTSMAVLVAVTAFALSMDYEVFLLSRIKEEHDAGRGTTDAVAFGLQRSGRIITAAAVILAVVFAAFVTSGVTNIKQLGLGVSFAILLDATVVRGLAVPAFMRLAGRWNWWAPRPLAALHRKIGLSDG